ncbi:MAG: hypothetical protein ABSG19_01540 [Candidatus Aminicenantales bacterium]
MLEPIEAQKDITSVFDGIENQLDKSLALQKDTIEKNLIEKLTREKEEARKRIEAAEQEFADGKRVLEGHKATLAELKTAKEQILGQIKGHLDRATSSRQMMEKMSNQAYEEYETVSHLSLELDGLRQRAEKEMSLLRKHLEEKYGVKAQFQAAFEPVESLLELRQEMAKMKKVRELLSTGPEAQAVEPSPVGFRPENPPNGPEPPAPAEAEAPEEVAAPQESEPAAEYEPAEDFEGEELRSLMDSLRQYRRTEPILNGTEFAYFQKGKKMILDGESFLGTVAKISDVAKGLHLNLGQKEMSKNLFLIKQEILNQQEILRKTFLRVVRFCEKEDGTLPQFVSEVLNVRIMKDILERLTFGNWSNPADFHSFVEHVSFLKDTFNTRAAGSRDYVKSVLEQLEGGTVMN